MTRDHLGGRDTFFRRLMRQEWRADDIPDREDVGVRRAQLAIYLDVSTRTELHASDFRMEIVRVRSAAPVTKNRAPRRAIRPSGGTISDTVLPLALPPPPALGFPWTSTPSLLQVPPTNRTPSR